MSLRNCASSAVLLREVLGQELDSLAGERAEPLAVGQVVENLDRALPVAPGKIDPVAALLVQYPVLPALHEEAAGRAKLMVSMP